MTGKLHSMTNADSLPAKPAQSDSGLFFSLINGRVCACWHGTDHRVDLGSLAEADAAMREFQLQTAVGERLNRPEAGS